MADKGHKPTSGMKSAARRALAWHKDGKRGGTSVGYARANQIVNGESLSDDTVKRMYSFFSRHEVDKKATGFNSGEEGYPSPGRVAWDLWGGDAGYAFARSKVKHTIKKEIMEMFEKTIGNNSSKAHDPIEEPGHVEYYAKGGDKIDMSGEDKTTTEPDPKGDIAVTKAVDSDLARRKITKAIKSLEKALKGLPNVGRASDVSVDNETSPVAKAADPDVSRADSVEVSNETSPVAKNVGNPDDVKGDGENSKPANEPVSTDAEPMTKGACCEDCGDDCTSEKTCCTKCMKMEKEYASAPAPSAASSSAPVTASVDDLEKAADTDKDGDTESDTDEDDDDKPVYKSAQELVDEAKINKSVWGGAFAAPAAPRIQ